MVFLEVISVSRSPPDAVLTASVGQDGGTVGRGQGNVLVLPDPERTVSRIHAQFLRRNGVVKVLCRGTNGLLVDGHLLEMGDEISLQDGARVDLGAYTLKVRLLTSASATRP